MLHVIDDQWKDHLLSMDHLKEGIGLRGYGQKDPLVEYERVIRPLQGHVRGRIEDETISVIATSFASSRARARCRSRRRFGIRRRRGGCRGAPEKSKYRGARGQQAKLAAQAPLQDIARSIQKRHERELKGITVAGTNGSTARSSLSRTADREPRRATLAPAAAARSSRSATGHDAGASGKR